MNIQKGCDCISFSFNFIQVTLFQSKHQLLSQSTFSPTDPSIHFHKLDLPNNSDLTKNALSYIGTAQPSAGRNHLFARMRLPSSSLIWSCPVKHLVSCLPLQNTAFTVPSRYSLLLNCAAWSSLWPSLNTTSLSLLLKEVGMNEVMRKHCLLLTCLTELSNIAQWNRKITSSGKRQDLHRMA